MGDQLDVLRLVAGRLDGAGIAYMVSGSIAMNYYAQPRLTRDIDVVVELGLGDAERVCKLFSGDFYVDEEAVREAIAAHGMFNVIHYDLVVKVDFIVRKETAYRQQEFSRRRAIEIDGKRIWIVTAEDLLLSKLVWTKDRRSELQLGDVRNLVESAEALDWGYLDRWAKELAVDDLLQRTRR